ncbi:hypothetical protein TWF694_002103 [Orbilia ellipsospora]|uniref:FAD-binding PCMH-type domain-containing protein n=1 Tax=Orbilia ellipsospora TaxID=2528407 RepID=A0AAV9X5X8_9PEZI
MFTIVAVFVGSCLIPPALGAPLALGNSSTCCGMLDNAFLRQGKVVYPASASYGALNTYWAQSSQEMPTCIFSPSNTQDVSTAVKLFTKNSCAFAIRSGGHSYNPGFSSIYDGVLMSLGKMNKVTYSTTSKCAKVQSGARWRNVYQAVEEYNVTVIGGQNADVGVGGYLLGGGISFLSNEYGWGTDNVKNFEIVLANGDIVNANQQSNTALFRALKGGSSNFGIVTEFTLNTVKVNAFTGTVGSYPDSSNDALMEAIFKYSTGDVDVDPKSHVIYLASFNETLEGQNLLFASYSDFMKLEDPPKVIKPFLDGSIPSGQLAIPQKNGTLGAMGDILNAFQSAGKRTTRQTMSIIPDLSLLKKLREVWVGVSKKYKDVAGFESEFAFQPIANKWIAASKSKGGNSMGIESPIFVLWVQSFWSAAADDGRMGGLETELITQLQDTAKAAGKLVSYEYLNYGGSKQDIISHYGTESVYNMVQVKKKYDPQNVFGTLVPGGFKIPGF